MLFIKIVLTSSIILQATSAILVLRLIRTTRHYWAWISLAIAIGLMALRRIVSFYDLLVKENIGAVNSTAEVIALIISILVLIGIINIRPILKSLYSAKANLEKTNERLNEEIKHRKEMEEKALANKEKFRKLTDHSPIMIWMSDQTSKCTYFNKPWLDFRGRTLEEESGMGWTEGLHEEDKENTINKYLQAFKKEEPFELEYRLRNSHNEFCWIYDKGTPMYDKHKNFTGYIGSCIDITSRKKTEEKLKHSEQQKSLILEAMREKLVFLDTDMKVQWTNQAALDLADKNEQEIKNQYCHELWHNKNNPCQNCPAEKTLKSGKTEESEIHFADKIFSIRTYPVRENGEITGIIEVGQDITARKNAEEKLRESEKEFRMFFDENNAVKLIINPDNGQIIAANKAAKQYYGYDDLTSKKIQEINQLPDKSVKKEMQKAFKEMQNLFYFKHKLANGEIRHVEAHATPLEINKTKYLYSIIHDITDRVKAENDLKKSEERFRKIVNTLPQFVSYCDNNLIYRFINRTYLERFNLEEENIVGKYIREIIGKESFEKARPHLERVLKGEKVHYKEYFRYPNGLKVHMEGTLIPDFDNYGKVAGYYAVLSDITHHVNNQKLLEESSNKLRSLSEHQQKMLEKERSYIAREIHDELGQNLSAIHMNLAMMKKQIPRSDRKLFSKLQELNRITQATLSKVKNLSAELRPQLLDDMGLIAALEWYAQNFEKSSNITCNLDLQAEEEDFPENMVIHIYRIVQEGLTNVYKHASAGSVDILLKKEGNRLILEITDDGKGIEEEDTRKSESFGIKGIEERVRLMNGSFNIDGNHPGTRLYVVIPL
jgi:two-component system sensor histidine kinase UhpB